MFNVIIVLNFLQSDRFSVVGLSTKAENWCSVGAYTRLARYSEWVYKSIEYFEGRPLLQPRQQLNAAAIDDEGLLLKMFDVLSYMNLVFVIPSKKFHLNYFIRSG